MFSRIVFVIHGFFSESPVGLQNHAYILCILNHDETQEISISQKAHKLHFSGIFKYNRNNTISKSLFHMKMEYKGTSVLDTRVSTKR